MVEISNNRHVITDEMLRALAREDRNYDWRLEPVNHTQSRFMHHVPPAQWAGEEQYSSRHMAFGTHRRGPNRSSR